jgi:predicted branched-subunit amino acid permease
MTALFTVIVVNQWMDTKEHKPAVIGGVVGVLCLLVLGADTFLLPALTITAIILLGVKKKCYIPSQS